MKKILSLIIGLVLIVVTVGSAQAHHNDGLDGLLLGAGGGAIIGQAIGRDTEATIVGSVIGGTLGLMLGMDRDHAVVYDRPRHVPQVRIVYNDRWDRHNRWERRYNRWERRHDRWDRKRHHRRHGRGWRHERRHHRR